MKILFRTSRRYGAHLPCRLTRAVRTLGRFSLSSPYLERRGSLWAGPGVRPHQRLHGLKLTVSSITQMLTIHVGRVGKSFGAICDTSSLNSRTGRVMPGLPVCTNHR